MVSKAHLCVKDSDSFTRRFFLRNQHQSMLCTKYYTDESIVHGILQLKHT